MKTKLIIIGVAIAILIGVIIIFSGSKTTSVPINVPADKVVYVNNNYGFSFSLPNDWSGYSIVENTWQGTPLAKNITKETGPTLVIRNPNWTSLVHFEDIPIMIFTLAQWNSYTAENFAVAAAPIPATELARNNSYVFALPPRWDYDYSKGYEEAENIIKSNPLKAFDIQKAVVLGDGRQCYTYSHDATKDEPYATTDFIDMTIVGSKVTGTRHGTQNGPDMTNGYTGTMVGTLENNKITSVLSYTVEGSKNKEQEIFQAGLTGIEKLRYQLLEGKGMLVPDTTKEFKILKYARVGCEPSN